jgi:hypothetical protein
MQEQQDRELKDFRPHNIREVVVTKGEPRAQTDAFGKGSEAKARDHKDSDALRSVKHGTVNERD